jgi:hypothetical protein
MIAHERIESTELHPARAQFIGRVQSEATDIGADVRDAEHVETQNGCSSTAVGDDRG